LTGSDPALRNEYVAITAHNDHIGFNHRPVAHDSLKAYNIVVRPEHRRRGYGAAIMNAAAIRCRDLGHPVLGLNVFAHNPNARALYDKLGYEVTHDYLTHDVPDAG